MSIERTVGFLGAGRMASALARGFLAGGCVRPDQLLASDIQEAARVSFARTVGGEVLSANADVVRRAQILVVAVKPAQIVPLLAGLRAELAGRPLVISIAAGIPLRALESGLPERTPVVRVMTNTPALVQAGASAYALGPHASPEDAAITHQLFSTVGLAFEVPEPLLDAVTGLSGSGPAYAALVLEALSDGGVAAGLPRDLATRLAAQTLLGTARLVLETGQHPGALKDMVASPGGTTIEGLHELEKAAVRGALMTAVRAAADKARQLGRG